MNAATRYWYDRAKTYGEEFPGRPPWTAHYWDSWQMPHRLALADALAAFPDPIHSIMEVGCNVGPNLRLWRSRWPSRLLLGCDVSPEAVRAAQGYFAGDQMTYVFRDNVETAAWLPTADLVVSCYALAYIEPGALDRVVERLWGSARLGMVLAEPMAFAAAWDAEVIEVTPPTYRYDYAERLRRRGAQVTAQEIPEADKLNAILTARRP